MIIKLSFWRGKEATTNDAFVIAEQLWIVDPPVQGGVGNCHMNVVNPIWTGANHIWIMHSYCFTPIGSIDLVQTRSNDDESDEPWIELYRRDKSIPFSYENEAQLTQILRELSRGHPPVPLGG